MGFSNPKCSTMIRLLLATLLIFSAVAGYAQQTISGVVKDSQGSPVTQANVVVTGTRAYAVTNEKGQFTLSFSEKLPVFIRVSSVGYKSQELTVDGTTSSIEITLADDILLSEVVITARRRK